MNKQARGVGDCPESAFEVLTKFESRRVGGEGGGGWRRRSWTVKTVDYSPSKSFEVSQTYISPNFLKNICSFSNE